jgi:Fe-S-cluster-containing dehydrogenase component
VDRIYDEKLDERDRKPACVLSCPTNARLFGDIKDPDSEIAQAIKERKGYQLMPEWETNPSNHYLPRQNPDYNALVEEKEQEEQQ